MATSGEKREKRVERGRVASVCDRGAGESGGWFGESRWVHGVHPAAAARGWR